jgi:uncharacterized protein (TIGR03086 family)
MARVSTEHERHRRALAGFTAVVEQGNGSWDSPSPCAGWTARDVVEHVIGFHEVLILRPLERNAHRPREGTTARWAATEAAIVGALDSLTEDMQRLLPALTNDVVVHTWDLATAIGTDVTLDPELVARALAVGPPPSGTEMFAAAIAISADAPALDRLLARYGREAHRA